MPQRYFRRGWAKMFMRVFVFIFIATMTNIAAPLSAVSTVIQGQVTYPDGSPAQDVQVQLHTPDGNMSTTETTNASGNYSFVDTLVAGTNYVLEVSAPTGYNKPSNSPTNFVYATGDALRTVNFQLVSANKIISGTVSYSDGTPVTDADVNVDPASTNGGQLSRVSTHTDSTGHYRVDVQTGTWFAQAAVNLSDQNAQWIAEEPPIQLTFSGSAAETQTANFTVTRANANLEVILLNSDGSKLTTSDFVADVDIKRADGVGTVRKVSSAASLINVNVTTGIYHICAFHPDLNGKSFNPADTTVSLTENRMVNLGTITAQVDSAHLKGRVIDTSGQGISGVQLQAINEAGCNRPTASTDATGAFDITVGAGTWVVGLAASNDPTRTQVAPATATVANGVTASGLSITLRTIDSTVTGSIVDSTGATVTNFVGSAYVRNAKSTARVSAPVINGTYTIKFASGDLSGTALVGAIADPGSGYGDAHEARVAMSNKVGSQNVTVSAYDAVITGTLKDPLGTTIVNSGSDINVYAIDTDGNFVSTTASDTDGTYSLTVGAGTWSVNYDIADPADTASLLDRPAGADSVTAKAGESVTKNLTVIKGTNTIHGIIRNTNFSLVLGVSVTVDNRGSLENSATINQNKIVTATTKTDATGAYSIQVPDGTYLVTVGETPDVGSTLLPPDGKTIKVSGAKSVTANFTFEGSDATITGKVKMNGKADGGGTVTAFSADGAQQTATVASDGTYTVSVTSGEKWNVVVTDLSGRTLAASDVAQITPKSGTNTQNLNMSDTGERVFGPVTKSFDASEAGSVSLPDGTTVTTPARALGISGTVTLTITPIINGNPTTGDVAAGLTYEVKATDPDGNELKTLNRPATITIPYPQQAIEEKGLREKSLSTKFFNPQTEQWEEATGFVDLQDNVAKLTTNHFSQFSVTGTMKKRPAVSAVKVASTSKTVIVLTVTGSNFTGKPTAMLGSVKASKVVLKGNILTITIPVKALKVGKQTLVITNGDGRVVTKTNAVSITKKGNTVKAAGLRLAPYILRYVK